MSSKVLTTIFVILFFVLLGEVGYFFYFSRTPEVENQLAPTILVPAPPSQPERQGVQAIKDDVLNYLYVANEGVIISSTLENQYQGKIIKLEISDGLKIIFQSENGAVNGYNFSKQELEKISVFRDNAGENEEITLNDLKLGDQITIDITLNLLNDLTNSLIESKITLISK